MKRELKILSLITLVLAALTVGFILLRDGSLSLYLAYPEPVEDVSQVTVSLDEETAKLVSLKKLSGGLGLKLKRTGTGKTPITVAYKSTRVTQILETGSLGVLVNRYNGDFTGWTFLLFAGFLWFLSAFLLFLRGYRRERKERLYSYTTVNFLGLSLLFGLMSFLGLMLLLIRGVDPFSFSFNSVLRALSLAMVYFALVSAPAVLLFALALCISNLALIRRERFRPVNLLGVFISLLMGLGLAGGVLLNHFLVSRFLLTDNFWGTALLNCYYGFYAFFVCMLFAVFILFGYIRRREPAYDRDFIVILGCRIRPDGTLFPLIRGRVDRALAFAEKQEAAGGPKAVFIPSGGKGEGEPVSEAEAMAAYLREKGIPEERILIENRSRTTRENLRFSRALAEARKPGGKAVFSTTNYHVFRSGILAGLEGWRPEGMGADTKWYFWPNAQIREFAGLLRENLKGILIFFLLIALQSLAVAALL